MLVCFVLPQACVYGVAAILWATAKFRLSPNQKLAVPRKLKRLLLEMAKRTAIERPSIVAAKKVLFIFALIHLSLANDRRYTHTQSSYVFRELPLHLFFLISTAVHNSKYSFMHHLTLTAQQTQKHLL